MSQVAASGGPRLIFRRVFAPGRSLALYGELFRTAGTCGKPFGWALSVERLVFLRGENAEAPNAILLGRSQHLIGHFKNLPNAVAGPEGLPGGRHHADDFQPPGRGLRDVQFESLA